MKLFSLVVLILFSTHASAQYSAAEIAKNKIHSISTKNGEYTTRLYYDQWGNDTAHYINGQIYQTKQHTYSNDKLVSTLVFNSEGKKYATTTYVFLQDGNYFYMNTDSDFGLTDYRYFDKNGRIMKDVIPDGSERIYSYDESGKLTSLKTKPMKDAVNVDVTYQYDSKNRLVKATSNGDFKWAETYSYNENGLIKNKTTSYVDEDGKKGSSITTYTYQFRK